MYYFLQTRNWQAILGLIPILCVTLLTSSRTIVLILFGTSTIAIANVILIEKHVAVDKSDVLYALPFVILIVVLSVLLSDTIIYRFNEVSFARVHLWSQLVDHNGLIKSVLGNGLRSAEQAAGRYVHNSYLSIWFDSGLIGLCIYLLIIGSLALPLSQRWFRGELDVYMPWLYLLLAIGAFLIPFSFQYRPTVWLVLGIIAGGLNRSSRQLRTQE